ncbi:MAG: hypothetical protein QOC63_2556 [Mycobacterium sp.]|jgi:hypothetical protein|nr:hypothetical protein [Mycobacterium sp.]
MNSLSSETRSIANDICGCHDDRVATPRAVRKTCGVQLSGLDTSTHAGTATMRCFLGEQTIARPTTFFCGRLPSRHELPREWAPAPARGERTAIFKVRPIRLAGASAATKGRMIDQRLRSTSRSCSQRNTVNLMRRGIVALATICANVSRLGSGRSGAGSQDIAAGTRRRSAFVACPPTTGLLSLPVKMQPVVRALTADTLSFIPNTTSSIDTIVPLGRKAAGRTHDRPRRASAMAIAELKPGKPKQKVR